MVTPRAPERGDWVWLDFMPQAGREQAGRRPAVVLSPRAYHEKSGLMLCCPVTSRVKGYPFEVTLDDLAGLQGVALADQLRSLDWRERRAEPGGRLPESVLQEILGKAMTLLR